MCVTELLQFGNECIVYRHVVLNHPNLTEILFEAKQFPSQLEVVLLSRISEYREFESHPMTSNYISLFPQYKFQMSPRRKI